MHRNPSQVDKASDREKRSPRRAANLIYGVADPVPVSSLIPLVAQQVIMLSVDLIFPVLIVAAVLALLGYSLFEKKINAFIERKKKEKKNIDT